MARKKTTAAGADPGPVPPDSPGPVKTKTAAQIVEENTANAKRMAELRLAEEKERVARVQTSDVFLRKFTVEVTPEEEKAIAEVLAKSRAEKVKAQGGYPTEKFVVGEDCVVRYAGDKYHLKKGTYSSDELIEKTPLNLSFDRAAFVAHLRSQPGVKLVAAKDEHEAKRKKKEAEAEG